MAILIPDMEMPDDCPRCPLAHWNKLDQLTGCEIVNRYVPRTDRVYWESDRRPDWCPLIEVHLPTRNADMDKLMQEAGWE